MPPHQYGSIPQQQEEEGTYGPPPLPARQGPPRILGGAAGTGTGGNPRAHGTPLLVKAGRRAKHTWEDWDIHLENERVYEYDTNNALDVASHRGEATVASEIVNIVKNLIGTGVLSLSGGLALFTNNPWVAVPTAAGWLLVLGAVSGYFCLLIAKVCHLTNSLTYRDCWDTTMGSSRLSVLVSLVNTLNPAFGNLAYSAVLSQTFVSLFETLGLQFNRVESLLIITVTLLLPLCWLKNLNALAPFSALGTLGIFLTALAMLVRFHDGSYLPGGKFHHSILPEYRPDFGTDVTPMKMLPFMCMVLEAFVMHYNSPRFYCELRDANLPKFTKVVSGSFLASGLIYITIAAAGYLTFGGNCDGYVLNNYSSRDPLATLCRITIAFSVLMTYPICFIGFRDGVVDMLADYIKPETKTSDTFLNSLTLVLLSLITVTASFVTDFGVINALGGGLLAAPMVFIFPAFMFREAIFHQTDGPTFADRMESVFAMILMVMGTCLGLLGSWQALQEL
mmetsp:Transcript_18711/g.37512  ORF Transcript_18711/g.37512 Transcript_18711/m.37512 type:complete len:507 (-) Transcript_18711:263-1783(-)